MKKRKNTVYGCGGFIAFALIVAWLMKYWYIVLILIGFWIYSVHKRNNQIRRSPFGNINFDAMGGQEFEYFCSNLLSSNGFERVRVTQGSGDHGIDILASLNGTSYAIQCKRYAKKVGNRAIQEAYSGKAIYGADIAVVMTNNYFTEQAESDARKLGVQLWSRNTILSLIRTADRNLENIEMNRR